MTQAKDTILKSAEKATSRSPQAMNRPAAGRPIAAEERHRMICEAAYFRALERGFVGGDIVEDWLIAERSIDQSLLTTAQATTPQPGKSISEAAPAALSGNASTRARQIR